MLREGHIEIEAGLLEQVVILAERGVNDLEEQLREDPDSVAPDEIGEAIESLRAAQQLL